MSQLDYDLLKVMGLSVADAATTLDRAKQTLYQGLSQSRNYFDTSEVLFLLRFITMKDYEHLDYVHDFIEKQYPDGAGQYVPRALGCGQIERLLTESVRGVLVTNRVVECALRYNNRDTALRRFMQSEKCIVCVSRPWLCGYFVEAHHVPITRTLCVEEMPLILSPLMFLISTTGLRCFFQTRFGDIGELDKVPVQNWEPWIRTHATRQ